MVQNVNDFIKQSAEDFYRSIEQSQLRDAEDNPADLGLHENEIKGQLIRDTVLTHEMVLRAINRACDFFGIPVVQVIKKGFVGELSRDPSTYSDDVFYFNRKQLMEELGIKGEDSLTLVYAHECVHRILQRLPNKDPWIAELACDSFAAIMAGYKGIDVNQFKESVCHREGTDIHPTGFLRGDFIEFFYDYGMNLKNNGMPCSFSMCWDAINNHVKDRLQDIIKARSETTIIENKYDYEGLNLFVNDLDWNLKQARICQEKAASLRNEASKKFEKGDVSNGKDLIKLAEQYESKAKDYLDSASLCTNKK